VCVALAGRMCLILCARAISTGPQTPPPDPMRATAAGSTLLSHVQLKTDPTAQETSQYRPDIELMPAARELQSGESGDAMDKGVGCMQGRAYGE